MLKNFPPHPRIPFPHPPGAYKEQGRGLRPARGHSRQQAPTPVSALATPAPTRHLCGIMKVCAAALAVLLCTAALCSQVSSVPRESAVSLRVARLSGHSQTTAIFSCGLESPRGKIENFLKGYKPSLLFSARLVFSSYKRVLGSLVPEPGWGRGVTVPFHRWQNRGLRK